MNNTHIGSSFDDFLTQEGLHEEATTHAMKRVIALEIEQAMQAQGLTKSAMVKCISTSRVQLDRLLDPENDRVQLDTIQRAASVLGRKLHLELT